MKRIKKAVLVPLRRMALQWNRMRLYYWADNELYELRSVFVLPTLYYRWLYYFCMRIVEFRKFQRIADRAIHTIPLQIRFFVADGYGNTYYHTIMK